MKIRKKTITPKKKKYFILFSLMFFLFLLIFYFNYNKWQSKQNSDERVVVFVLDAGDWRILNKLLSDGKLVNIRHLINNGVSGKSQSVAPLYTPPNMASLFTGKVPQKHKIMSHFDVTTGDTKNQLYRNMNATPLWGILKNTGITFDLVGFQEFDYAPRIDGTIVTGIYLIKKVAEHNNYLSNVDSGGLTFLKYIPDFILISKNKGDILTNYDFLDNSTQIMSKYNLSLKFNSEVTRVMVPFIINQLKETEKSKKGNMEFSKIVTGLEAFFDSDVSAKFMFEHDMLSKEIALDLYKKHKSNILFVYFAGTDVFGHSYYFDGWHLEDKKNEQEQFYKYYEIIDGYIGEFLNNSDENTTFFITSDHGIQNMTLQQYTTYIPHPSPHTPYGIFIAQGKNIKQGAKIKNEAIFDVLPTLLYIYDQPIAEDFDGSVLMDIFNYNYTKGKAVKHISTYEKIK